VLGRLNDRNAVTMRAAARKPPPFVVAQKQRDLAALMSDLKAGGGWVSDSWAGALLRDSDNGSSLFGGGCERGLRGAPGDAGGGAIRVLPGR